MATPENATLRLVAPPSVETAIAPGHTDDELTILSRGGDRAAFEDLVRRHQSKVIAFATRFFGQEAMAFDVAQDVFLDVMKALPRYRAEGRFVVWLYRITLNRCRMTARSVRYLERARDRIFVENADRVGPDQAAARDRERRLRRALLELPEKHRAVLQLRFWGGLSHEEIAGVLETNVGTVKSRVWNALATLREELGDIE